MQAQSVFLYSVYGSDKCEIEIKLCILKSHSIHRPHGQAMKCFFFLLFWRKLPSYEDVRLHLSFALTRLIKCTWLHVQHLMENTPICLEMCYPIQHFILIKLSQGNNIYLCFLVSKFSVCFCSQTRAIMAGFRASELQGFQSVMLCVWWTFCCPGTR